MEILFTLVVVLVAVFMEYLNYRVVHKLSVIGTLLVVVGVVILGMQIVERFFS